MNLAPPLCEGRVISTGDRCRRCSGTCASRERSPEGARFPRGGRYAAELSRMGHWSMTEKSSGATPAAARLKCDSRGKLFVDSRNPMTPTFAIKKRVRYWYYFSSALHQGRTEEAGSIRRVETEAVELPARSASVKLPRSERDADAPDAAERIAANVD